MCAQDTTGRRGGRPFLLRYGPGLPRRLRAACAASEPEVEMIRGVLWLVYRFTESGRAYEVCRPAREAEGDAEHHEHDGGATMPTLKEPAATVLHWSYVPQRIKRLCDTVEPRFEPDDNGWGDGWLIYDVTDAKGRRYSVWQEVMG